MKARVRSFLFSFQTKLVLAIPAVILLSIFLAGAVFVVQTRDEQRQDALDRVAAASPAVYQQIVYSLYYEEDPDQPVADALDNVALEQDVRILLVGPGGGVLHDTDDRLTGTTLEIPRSTFSDISRGFIAWRPSGDFPEDNLMLVSASSRATAGPGAREAPLRIVLAVESDTIADAWLDVLPGLALAALIAVPLSAIAGILLARQVAHPVHELTLASEAMARGDFDQHVRVDRADEIGRLSRSFTSMAEHISEREAQMRALVANVSHDLKTPMTSITGYAHALTDGTADHDDVVRIGTVISEEAQHVNRLLDDLLYLGDIDANQLLTRREDVALEPLVARCLGRIEPVTAARDISVRGDVAEAIVLRNVDGEKLERALTNILDNAAKFTPDAGSITLTASAAEGLTSIEVHNTGSRIPEEDLAHLFERFFRSDRARRSASGNGLGLAITSEIVEMHGGRVSARNVADGVIFRIELPAST